MSDNSITLNNETPSDAAPTLLLPPNSPLNMGALAILFNSMTPQSSAPSDPAEGDVYLDDGTNTDSSTLGFRRYTGSAWEDFGLQSSAISSTPTSGQYAVTDIRLSSDLALIVEYDDTPEA